ncbi:hypothetical protein AQUCO_00201068v1 [Aquilegia coerulea]|uniref:Uncharacterized protein n=1 Tax=Aquilegia coerulea TaxID=218851 RepID=A0A2G5F621_AQUCA|nr:hypothetical protein AQUCO_00201068v1 [Aquilegia coerulea]
MESIVARDEDLVHGCSKLHDSILDIFQNTDNTFVGFNLHVLKYHLSALGINIGAAFIDLAEEKGIRNWEKGVTDLIGFKKITHSDSSIIVLPCSLEKWDVKLCYIHCIQLNVLGYQVYGFFMSYKHAKFFSTQLEDYSNNLTKEKTNYSICKSQIIQLCKTIETIVQKKESK